MARTGQIGKVARRTGLSIHTIRFHEKERCRDVAGMV